MSRITADHYAAVYRFCARRIGPDLAADAAQETFLTAQRHFKKLDPAAKPLTWLLGIALNVSRNLSRKRRNSVPYDDLWDERATGFDETGLIDREVLRQVLTKLPPEQLSVVVLHEVDGLTYEEAAKVLGIPVGTVKSRLHSAFATMRRHMTAEAATR